MRQFSGATVAAADWRRVQARAGSIGILTRQAALKGLDASDLEAIARASRARSWDVGASIYRRGDQSRDLILIAEGRVRLSVLAVSGSALALRHAGSGTMIGEVGVLHGGDRHDDATAITAVEALAIPKVEVDRLLAERPAIARALIGALCDRIRATTEQLESIALYSVEARLARLLLGFAREADTGAPTVAFTLPLTQSEAGDLIGASRPKVNRAFSRLEESEAIRRAGKVVRCDIARLSACAESR